MGFEVRNGCLIKYTGKDKNVVIPEGVTSIGEAVFSRCRSLTSVMIPNSVTSIGDWAFGCCENLTSVTIPNSVTSIGESAFNQCSSLTSVMIPNSVTSIGDLAFHECSNLTSVTISNGVMSIGNMAFYKCTSLMSVTISTGVKNSESTTSKMEIGDYAFYECSSLTDMTIPEDVTSIGNSAFNRCRSLKSVTIPEGVTSIGDVAFHECSSLTSIVIPDTVQKLSTGIFYGCSNLQTLRMPYALLQTNPFSPSSKMVTLELTKDGNVVETVPAVFRKDYPSKPNWLHKEDYLIPIGKDSILLFDNLIAAGTYDGFTTNEDQRIAAILWRLNTKDIPIKEELLSLIRDFLSAKLEKAAKIAIQGKTLDNIRNLISLGVISSENEQQVVKILKRSKDEDIKEISNVLGQLIAEIKLINSDDEKPFPLDDRFKKIYIEDAVHLKMVKFGIEIPELKADDGDSYVPKECIQLFIVMYMKGSGINPLADEVVKTIERDTLNAVLLKNYEKQARTKDKLFLLNAVMRFADEKTVRTVFKEMSKWHLYEVLQAVCLNDSRAAMLIAEQNKCLARYARLRGMDEETFRDTVLANFDLDSNGTKKYDLGGTIIAAALKKDMTVELFDTKQNKVVKSIPKKGNDESLVAAATKDFSDLKKNIKKVVKSRFTRLFEDFREGTKQTADRWKAVYLSNPVLRQAANLVVWKQGTATFILREEQPILADGRAYVISDKPIYVAHPMEMKPKDVAAWQTYFLDNDLKQPFEQIWEPVIQPEDVKPDRYVGATIPCFRFLNAEKHGIDVRSEDSSTEIIITFEGCDADVERVERMDWSRNGTSPNDRFEVKMFKFKKYTRQVNHIVAYLDKATVYDRILKDDVSVTQYLHNFTAAQIVEFITLAAENKAVNVAAALLEYKQQHFGDVDSLAEYTLDW